jgi:nickel/cobalt exporter
MGEGLLYLATSVWLGAVHASTPGLGKAIAASCIVGVRGRPVDALVLGLFVTLSHTSGIVLVALLATAGAAWLIPHRVGAYVAVATGVLVVGIGCWMLRTQLRRLASARFWHGGRGVPAGAANGAGHDHPYGHGPHDHHDHGPHSHSHGWSTVHSHDLEAMAQDRPRRGVVRVRGERLDTGERSARRAHRPASPAVGARPDSRPGLRRGGFPAAPARP